MPFPVVGIGASAGGLEAFSQLLGHLPVDTGMAFVLVQHLDPKHASKLSDLLAKYTTMPVVEVTQDLAVEADHVYVIPPNFTLTFIRGTLHLEPRDGHGPHVIDYFFKSLATDRQAGAIGVVLSGTGTDGTLGLQEIKASGGITFAQDEQSAKFAGMPQSASKSGCIDRILPPEKISEELARIGKNPYVASLSTTDPQATRGQTNDFARILALLRSTFGVDFSAYRDTTINRRILRRMVLHTRDSLAAYARLLEQDRAELGALYQDILINVTSFFRDPETFEAIKTQAFPQMLKDKPLDAPIRIWVPGCSTGQEAYSLAMILLEFLGEQTYRRTIQIFATDLSDTFALVKAREGCYPESIEAEVSPERLQRFFSKEDGVYRVHKDLRKMVVFAKQNVATDPPFSHLDLISCRNLLIYLSPPLQKRVIPTFHFALNPTGFLVLGGSETIGGHTDLFSAVDSENRIYIKKSTASRQYPHFRAEDYHARIMAGGVQAPEQPTAADWKREADRIALGQYVPPGVLVNANLDILQFRGNTGPYLTPSPGEPSHNLFKMAREGLFLELRSAIAECQETSMAVIHPDLRIRGNGEDVEFDLKVWPVRLPNAGEICYLIAFEERLSHLPLKAASGPAATPSDEIARLRHELASTREYLQSVIAQQDAGNEDLRSANEEILSSNEELQSTNEELETAKEELQSVNEELTTVNEQLQNRNADMTRLNDDLTNLINSAHVPTIVVDIDLRIRRFTPTAGLLLNLLPGDVGRPLGNIKPTLAIHDLEALVTRVMTTVHVEEREVRDVHGRWFLLRIHPYRTSDNKIDGAVAVFVDVDEAKRAQEALRDAMEYSQSIIETVLVPLVILDADLSVRSANPAYYRMFRTNRQQIEGQHLYELGNRQWDVPELRRQLEVVLPQNSSFDDFELTHDIEGIGERTLVLNARRIVRGDQQTELILLAIEDRTVSIRLSNELRQHVSRLSNEDRERTVFLALLAHELRNPLAPVRNALRIIQLSGGDGEMVQSATGMMERQIGHMVRLVEDLIDVSRISQGKITLQMERLDLVPVVKHAIDAAGASTVAMDLEASVTLPPRSVYVEGDATRITQIVGNLLNNAYKFSDKTGRIELTVELVDSWAVIRVRDGGIGIPPEHLPHIFDMFMQVDTSLGRSVGGLGIGLALVKHLVEKHGGTLSAASDGLGKGSEFTVRLPLSADQTTPERRATIRDDIPATMPPRRILVVDDNQDAAASLGLLLAHSGHEVQTAFDGAQALDIAQRTKPDIIFLDIGLPKLNGYEVAQRIRKEPWGEKVLLIALTGWGKSEDREQSRRAGFDIHLVKPVKFDEVLVFLHGNGSAARGGR